MSGAEVALRSATPRSGAALVINLGPAWSAASAYSVFGDTPVMELPFRDWESPPGLGTPPLDVAFAVCKVLSSWLANGPDHVALLHARAVSPAGGASLVRFLAACYATFNADAASVAAALAALPPPPPRALRSTYLSSSSSPGGGEPGTPPPGVLNGWRLPGLATPRASGGGTPRAGSSGGGAFAGPHTGPAQARYGAYFSDVLHSQSLDVNAPPGRRLARVVLSSLAPLDARAAAPPTDDGAPPPPAPFLVVFQHGRRVWSGYPSEQVSVWVWGGRRVGGREGGGVGSVGSF